MAEQKPRPVAQPVGSHRMPRPASLCCHSCPLSSLPSVPHAASGLPQGSHALPQRQFNFSGFFCSSDHCPGCFPKCFPSLVSPPSRSTDQRLFPTYVATQGFLQPGRGGGPASQHHFHSQQLQVEPLSPKIGASSRKAGLDPNKTNHWCFWGLGGFRLQILAGNSQPSSFSETPGGWTTYHRSPAGPGARLKVLQKTDGDVSDAKGRDWMNGSRGCLERAELGEMAAAHLQSAGGVLCAN